MRARAGSEGAAGTTGGHVAGQVRRLVWLRWCSVCLMVVSALMVPPGLGLSLPVGPLLAVAFALAAFNAFTLAMLAAVPGRETSWLFVQLLADVVGWSTFVHYSGGATNPLISLLLPLTAIGAAVLPARLAWLLAACAVGCYSLLWNFYIPVRLRDPDVATYWHLAGMWATFALSAMVIVGFVLRMTAALRERDLALTEALQMRARDQALVSLGSLAAGAAHSLGTPLGTIRLLVDDLVDRPSLESDVKDDLRLIGQQIEHCRRTLSVLTTRAGRTRADERVRTAAEAWVREVLVGWQSQRPQAQSVLRVEAAARGVFLAVDESLAQALETLLNNAADASGETTEVRLKSDHQRVVIEVADRGDGIPIDQLRELGRRPLGDDGKGLGIGVFLAGSALDRAGGRLEFERRDGGGTLARMVLLPMAMDQSEDGKENG